MIHRTTCSKSRQYRFNINLIHFPSFTRGEKIMTDTTVSTTQLQNTHNEFHPLTLPVHNKKWTVFKKIKKI